MRKHTRLIALMLVALIATLTSCQQSPREMLVGEYKISSITSDQKLSNDDKAAWQEEMENLKKTAMLKLKADGSLEQSICGVTQRGSWEVFGEESEEGEIMKLKFVMESKSTVTMEIHDLSNSGFTDTEYDENSKSKTIIIYSKVK